MLRYRCGERGHHYICGSRRQAHSKNQAGDCRDKENQERTGPPARTSIASVIIPPRPKVTTPTIIPAAATATPIPIIFLPPATRACHNCLRAFSRAGFHPAFSPPSFLRAFQRFSRGIESPGRLWLETRQVPVNDGIPPVQR